VLNLKYQLNKPHGKKAFRHKLWFLRCSTFPLHDNTIYFQGNFGYGRRTGRAIIRAVSRRNLTAIMQVFNAGLWWTEWVQGLFLQVKVVSHTYRWRISDVSVPYQCRPCGVRHRNIVTCILNKTIHTSCELNGTDKYKSKFIGFSSASIIPLLLRIYSYITSGMDKRLISSSVPQRYNLTVSVKHSTKLEKQSRPFSVKNKSSLHSGSHKAVSFKEYAINLAPRNSWRGPIRMESLEDTTCYTHEFWSVQKTVCCVAFCVLGT
jgi:hypothetical protein